jgi:hypothetical protein
MTGSSSAFKAGKNVSGRPGSAACSRLRRWRGGDPRRPESSSPRPSDARRAGPVYREISYSARTGAIAAGRIG